MAFPLIAAGITGLASLIGGRERNRAASAQSQRQMDFQERMSNTAHQREVADLRAAGLNPILSGTGGAGASSPGGAQAPMQDVLSPAVSSALAAKRLGQEIQNMKASRKLTDQQAATSAADMLLKRTQRGAIRPVGEIGDAIGETLGSGGNWLRNAGSWATNSAKYIMDSFQRAIRQEDETNRERKRDFPTNSPVQEGSNAQRRRRTER